jgi:hypothetical protein
VQDAEDPGAWRQEGTAQTEVLMPCKSKWPTIRKRIEDKGAKIEAKEHPWLTKRQARKVAKDHIRREGLRAYAK